MNILSRSSCKRVGFALAVIACAFGIAQAAPMARFSSPLEGSVLSHRTSMSLNLSGATRYEVYLDGALYLSANKSAGTTAITRSVDTYLISNGAHVFQLISYDSVGVSSQATVGFSVNNPYNARVVSAVGLPAVVEVGRSYEVEVTVENAGDLPWTTDCALKNITHAVGWEPHIAHGLTQTVNPGQPSTFRFTVTAPNMPGTLPFKYGMYKFGYLNDQNFGQMAIDQSVQVVNALPVPPAGVFFSSSTETTLIFQWSEVSGVAAYLVDISTASDFSSFWNGWRDGYQIANDPVFLNGLPWGTTFYGRVRTRDAAGFNSPYSSVAAGTTLKDSTPPQVNVVCPIDGEFYAGTVGVSATAVDAASGIDRLEFFVDGRVLVSTPSGSLSYSWHTGFESEGGHVVRIAATDRAGNQSYREMTGTVDRTLPVVSLVSPVPDAAVQGLVSLAAEASDQVGLLRITFRVDGISVFSDAVAPYGGPWDSRSVKDGTHTVQAEAWDRAGNVAFSSPTVLLVDNPAPGTPLNVAFSEASTGSLKLTWTAVTNATSYRVDVASAPDFGSFMPGWQDRFVGYAAPQVISGLAPGTVYYARVRAVGNGGVSGNGTTSGSTLGAPDLLISELRLATPERAALKPGEPYSLSVGLANEGTGFVGTAEAALMVDGVSQGVRASGPLPPGAPWTSLWSGLPALAHGTHTVTATADPSGAIAESDETNNQRSLTVLVDGNAPAVFFRSPAPGSRVAGVVAVEAGTFDDLSGVARVELAADGAVVASASSEPWRFDWDSRTAAYGSHQLSLRSWDWAENVGVTTITVTVDNTGGALRVAASGPGSPWTRQKVALNVTLRNTGSEAWTKAGGYALRAQNPSGSLAWGVAQVNLAATDRIEPGQEKAFTFTVTAPSTAGVHGLDYQMAKAGAAFGEAAFRQDVAVRADVAAPSVPTAVAFTGAAPDRIVLKWTASTDNVSLKGYRVDLSTRADFGTFAPGWEDRPLNVGVSTTIAGLAADTAYYGRLRAEDVNGLLSAHSAAAMGRTLAGPDVTAPVASLTNPKPGQVMTGPLTLQATATDDNAVQKVEFLVDGALKGTDAAAPYALSWDARTVAAGTHTVTARAWDYAGNMSSATVAVARVVDQGPPTVPLNVRAIYPRDTRLTFAWDASTDDVAVTGYRLDVSTAAGFGTMLAGYNNLSVGLVLSREVSGLTPGTTYYARVRALDALSQVSNSSLVAAGRTLATPDTAPPTLTITSPAANAVVSGTATVTAEATDANGIRKVLFYLDNALRYTVTAAPYEWVWDTGAAAEGKHTLKVVAYDASNLAATRQISVTVSRQAPGMMALGVGPLAAEPFGLRDAYVYPHPVVNGRATVHVEAGDADRVTMRLFNLLGERVWEATVDGGPAPSSNGSLAHEKTLDAGGLASGTYLLQVEAEKAGDAQRTTKKIAIVR